MACWTPVINSDYMLRWLIDVNDGNFWNWRMLIVNSNCDHEYVDPTTLFQSLMPSTFLSLTDTPNAYTWFWSWIIRVNSAWDALEFVDPSTLNIWTDRLVASEMWATPWYLWDVLDVVSWELVKTVSWNKVVIWLDPSVLNSIAGNFLALTDTPSSYSWHAGECPVVNNSENWLEFLNIWDKKLRARRYMSSDYSITQNINVADSTFVVQNMDWFEWDWSMNWSYSWTPAILIPKKWLYKVTVKGNMWFSKWVLAWRIMAASTPPSAHAPMCDTKFWSRDSSNWHWAFPRDMVVTYWQSMIYEFEAWTFVYTWWIISTNVWAIWWWITSWTIDILHGNVRWSGSDDRWHTLEVSRFSSKY